MTIDLRGSDPPPPVAPLASSIAGALGQPVTVVVEFARVEQAQASAAP
jgi:hypothetical protein